MRVISSSAHMNFSEWVWKLIQGRLLVPSPSLLHMSKPSLWAVILSAYLCIPLPVHGSISRVRICRAVAPSGAREQAVQTVFPAEMCGNRTISYLCHFSGQCSGFDVVTCLLQGFYLISDCYHLKWETFIYVVSLWSQRSNHGSASACSECWLDACFTFSYSDFKLYIL